jgi:hypothetical protein
MEGRDLRARLSFFSALQRAINNFRNLSTLSAVQDMRTGEIVPAQAGKILLNLPPLSRSPWIETRYGS